ncbi:hypothetical protein QOZ80_9AG0680700 [Eleusine coracana subsp. coracana]|nr:hypothetical protein QOZ80_9AG0680700 [Eleusine coracana subsp. coracana]
MYFETASRKRRSNSGITPPPGASPARTDTKPGGPRTPSRTVDAKPLKSTDRANRSRNQGKAGYGGSSVPTFGEWNENNGSGGQQYTIVFDQLQKERSARPTPSMGQPQRTTPNRATHHDLYDEVPKLWRRLRP